MVGTKLTDSLQYLLVTAILLTAVGYLARRGWRRLRGRGGCASGCSGCPQAEDNGVTLITLQRPSDRE
jgi:hypothetical protein